MEILDHQALASPPIAKDLNQRLSTEVQENLLEDNLFQN